ncbi:MAG: hypothetical protein ACRYGR_04880 [Janthinobacterium lividum]
MFKSIITGVFISLLQLSISLQASSTALLEEITPESVPSTNVVKKGSDIVIDLEKGGHTFLEAQYITQNISYIQWWGQKIDWCNITTAGVLKIATPILNTGTSICVLGTTITTGMLQYMDSENPTFETVKNVNFYASLASTALSLTALWAARESSKRYALVQTQLNDHQSTINNLQSQLARTE